MNHQPGKIGAAEGLSLAFIITTPAMFLSTPAIVAEKVGTLVWLGAIVGAALTMAALLLLSSIFKNIKGDLIDATEFLLSKAAAKILCLFYIVMFFSLATIWVREFAENTLLTALPRADFDIVIIWYGASAALLVYTSIEVICRATYVFLPFIIGGFMLVLVMLYPFCEVNLLLPWQGKGLPTVALTTIPLVGSHAGVMILTVLGSSLQNIATFRTSIIYGVALNAILRAVSAAVFLMVFGPNVALEKSLPFFEMTRLVYLSRYIQRIESLFILLWVIVGILAIAASIFAGLHLVARLAGLPTIRPLIPAAAFIVIQLAIIAPDLATVTNLETQMFTYYHSIGVIVIPLIIFIAYWIKGRQKPCA